ncbi:hypothetical protein BKA61DRAFT_262366 [Leptodontidium sp. MPI-SDFR-AT-0119]|nr:hypothetical protein BKA61DRAFT_255473 [Leptodontidium sp. MPI-SDFR-AT-0119]KAH6718752.1 hypothetical protein BKA61DRAFT_262366 [Leptodontidium sp. MPI-SDFR-AT-0119]
MATSAPTVTLTSKREMFPPWLAELKAQAMVRGAWHHVDPDGPDSPHTADSEPALPPTIEELIHIEDKHRQNTWEVDIRDIPDRPAILPARFKDVEKEYQAYQRDYSMRHTRWAASNQRYQVLWEWVNQSVPHMLLEPHKEQLIAEGRLTLQNLVRELQKKYAPTPEWYKQHRRDAYLDVLETGKQGSIHPNTWLDNWFQALARAKSLKLDVVEGTSAIQTFLETVAVRVAPEWSAEQLRRVLEADAMGEKPSRTLEEYGRILETYLQVTTAAKKRLDRKGTGGGGAYATLGGRGDGTNKCPCQRKHAWLPGDCSRLELALTGRTERQIQLSDDDKKSIRQRLELSEYQQLRERLREKGWLGSGSGSGDGASNEGAKGKATWEGKGPIEA